MPEGDTVHRTARRLNEVLAGQVLTVCDLRVPRYATVDLTGQRVDEVVARGKHLLHRIGDRTVHSHLKMEGAWHVYRLGSPWQRAAYRARAVLATESWVTVGFDLGVLEVVPRAEEHAVVGHLGPDPLGPDWDLTEATRRTAAEPAREIGLALLDQSAVAGLGNVYRNEVLFLRGVLPTRPVGRVDDLPGMLGLAHRLIVANLDRSERTTTGDLRRGHTLWVHGREGKPCRRCGTPIRRGRLGDTGLSERDTYFCPRCQS